MSVPSSGIAQRLRSETVSWQRHRRELAVEAAASIEALEVAVLRFMAEDHSDWRDIHAQEIARLLDVPPGDEPFKWRWADRLAEVTA